MKEIIGKQIHDGVLFGEVFVYDHRKEFLTGLQGTGALIVAAEDLTPNETIQFEKLNVYAFVATNATETSHVAILARTMDLPAITGISIEQKR